MLRFSHSLAINERQMIMKLDEKAPLPAERQGTERRSSRRRSVFLRAKVKLPGIAVPVNCVVRNISPMGALIHFERPTPTPANFKLVIEADFFQADCIVRHVSGEDVGVEFTSSRMEALARYS